MSVDLSALDQKLADRATNLEQERSRLDQLGETWQATLQSTTQPDAPQSVLHRVQSTIDSIERTRQATESARLQLLSAQGDLSEQQARVRTALFSVEQAQNQAVLYFGAQSTGFGAKAFRFDLLCADVGYF